MLICLCIIYLYLIYCLSSNILGCHGRIITKKLFSIYKHLLYPLTMSRDLSFTVYLETWKLF